MKYCLSLLRLTVFISLVFLQTNCNQSANSQAIVLLAPPPGVENLKSFLEEVRARYELPGIVVAVFNADSLIAVGSAGTRKMKAIFCAQVRVTRTCRT